MLLELGNEMGIGLVEFIESIASLHGYYSKDALTRLEFGVGVELLVPMRIKRTNSYLELCFVRGVTGLWHVHSDRAVDPMEVSKLQGCDPNEYAPSILVNPKVDIFANTPGRLYMESLPEMTYWRYADDSPLSQPKIVSYQS